MFHRYFWGYCFNNSITSGKDNFFPAETTFSLITNAGKLKILYSMIFKISSSLSNVASKFRSYTACSTVAYKALQFAQPVPKTLISIFPVLYIKRNSQNNEQHI